MKNYLMLLSTKNEENSDVFLFHVSKSKEQAKNEFKIQKAERKLQF